MENAIRFRRLSRLLFGSAVLTLVLVMVGAIVRSTGSGLGCGTAGGWHDWPLCHGQWIPPATSEALIEFSHRAFAGTVALCVLGAAGWTLATPALRRDFGLPVVGTVGLLGLQIALGALAVRMLDAGGINPAFVVAHLATAFAFFGVLVVFGLRAARLASGAVAGAPGPIQARALAVVAAAVVFGQALLGGLVANLGGSLACPEFPTCAGGAWIPTMAGPIGLQIAHRVGALVVLAAVVALPFALPRQRGLAWAGVGLAAFQVVLGAVTIWLGLPLLARAAHHVTAYALFGIMVAIACGTLTPARAGAEEAPAG